MEALIGLGLFFGSLFLVIRKQSRFGSGAGGGGTRGPVRTPSPVPAEVQGPPAPADMVRWRAEFEQKSRAVKQAVPEAIETSGLRTPQENIDAGGDPESQHLFGLAKDYDIASDDQRERNKAYKKIAKAARAQGLVAVVKRDHVHTQFFRAGHLASLGVIFPRA